MRKVNAGKRIVPINFLNRLWLWAVDGRVPVQPWVRSVGRIRRVIGELRDRGREARVRGERGAREVLGARGEQVVEDQGGDADGQVIAEADAAHVTRAMVEEALCAFYGRKVRLTVNAEEALAAFAMPAAFGLAFVAADFTHVILGQKWDAAIPAIRLLAPVIGLQSLFYASQAYAVALGLTRLVFFRELIFFFIRMPVFVWAALAHGLMGAVLAAAGTGLFHSVLNLALYARSSGGRFWEPLAALYSWLHDQRGVWPPEMRDGHLIQVGNHGSGHPGIIRIPRLKGLKIAVIILRRKKGGNVNTFNF